MVLYLYFVMCYTMIFFFIIFFFCDCLVKLLDILFNFFLKLNLFDEFSCNFKYIFINEIDFIKKNCISCREN